MSELCFVDMDDDVFTADKCEVDPDGSFNISINYETFFITKKQAKQLRDALTTFIGDE